MTDKALRGIRVVDLSMGWAGPLACRHLADMGADVIKVEGCERFDWWRSWEATPEWITDNGAEKSTAFNTVNRNKRDITLDLQHPEGRKLLLRLVETAHVVVENFSGSVLPKLDLSFEVFREVNKRIILVSMPAFGSTGPWRNFRAYGSTVEQSSGLPHLNGLETDPPTMHHVAFGDPIGGLNGASAILVALRHQARSGQGQFVDLSQVESIFPLASHGIMHFCVHGSPPIRQGNRSDDFAPHGVYPCADATSEDLSQNPDEGGDQWIVIQVLNETQWQALCAFANGALDQFTDLDDRLVRREELDRSIAAMTRHHNAHDLMLTLQAIGIPAAATNTTGSLVNDPHLRAREYWQWHDRAVVGRQPNPSAPYRFGDDPIPIESPAPTLGQHNEEVLGEILGVTNEELERLSMLGIIGKQPRMPSGR